MSNKLIEQNQSPEVLKICAGNDFSLRIYCTQYDTETKDWVNYDLSNCQELQFYLVSTQFKRIKLNQTLQSDGSIVVDVLANYLQQTTYGVEMTWLSGNGKNRRTYTPIMVQIVRTTEEAQTDIEQYENSVYNLNIRINSDIDMIRIGGRTSGGDTDDFVTISYLESNYFDKNYIDDYFYDKGEVDNLMTSYINETDLQAALESFDAEISSEFVDNTELSEQLSYYVSSDDLNDMHLASQSYVNEKIAEIPPTDLTGYVSKQELSAMSYVDATTLSECGYVTSASIPDVSNLVTYSYLSSKNYTSLQGVADAGFLKQEDLSAQSYATTNFVEQSINAIDIPDVSNFVSQTTFESTLQSYITETELSTTLNNAGYITNGDLQDYATKNDLSSYVSKTDLSSMSYATTSDVSTAISNIDMSSYAQITDLSSYVSKTDLNSMSYATTSDVSTAISNIDMSSYITSDELDSMGYITADDIPELPDTSGFVTNEQLSAMSYATTSDVSTAISNIDMTSYAKVTDLSSYVSKTDLSSMSYATTSDVSTAISNIDMSSYAQIADLTSYVTKTELSNCGYITISDVPEPDLSSYVTKTELSNCGYITISDVPEPDLTSYVTKTELSNASYVTQTEISNAGYITSNDLPTNGVKFVSGSPINVTYLWAGEKSQLPVNKDNNTLYITTDETSYVDLTPYELKSNAQSYYATIPTIVVCYQAEYDALVSGGTVDASTIYMIKQS